MALYARRWTKASLGHAIIVAASPRVTRITLSSVHVQHSRVFVACFGVRALRRNRFVVPRRSIHLPARCAIEAAVMEEQAPGRQSADDRRVDKFVLVLPFSVESNQGVRG